MKDIEHLTPEGIYCYIISHSSFMRDGYTCIISGKNGPTGKSWLTSQLNELGYDAIEITEPLGVSGSVSYNDDTNHLIVDEFHRSIVIILNKILDNYELRNGCFVRKVVH